MDTDQKYLNAKEIIKGLEKVVVAFSGGVDSTFLLKCCVDVLGENNVLAFIGQSPTFPVREIEEAKLLSALIGAEYVIEETPEIEDPNYIRNDKSRCYYCKNHLFNKIWKVAKEKGFFNVVEGSNLDDMNDFRPGRKACIEQKVVSPLLMAGLTKNEIRALSKRLNLPTHDKPAFACLSSRIPYGTAIEINILKKIELSEWFMKSLGIRQVRVRYHGSIARIEVFKDEINKVIENREQILKALSEYGFLYVTLDLEGYVTGSMNKE